MSEFKVGDLVECIAFEGAAGKWFSPSTAYQIKAIRPLDSKIGIQHLSFVGLFDSAGIPIEAYSYRFIPLSRSTFILSRSTFIDEYDSIIEAQDIYKSLIDG